MPDYERRKMQTPDIWAAEQGLGSLPGPVRHSRAGRRRRSRGGKERPRPLGAQPPTILAVPIREPRDAVSPAPGQLPGGMPGLPGTAKLLLPLGHPALSFLPRASTKLRHLPRSCHIPHTTVTEREKKREGRYCSYKSLDGRR